MIVIGTAASMLWVPRLLDRWGRKRGSLAGFASALLASALGGAAAVQESFELILLRVGWNLLFGGGTSLLPLCHTPAEQFKAQTASELVVFGSQGVARLSGGADSTAGISAERDER